MMRPACSVGFGFLAGGTAVRARPALPATAVALVLAALLAPAAAGPVTLPDGLHSEIARGNRHYDTGEHDRALSAYERAAARDSASSIPLFNSGAALYRLGRFEQGAKEFLKSASASADSVSAMSYYNLGNTAFKMGDYGAAAEAYKRSLLLAPGDADAKYNLEYALRMIQQQQQQDQQNQDQQNHKQQDRDQQGEGQDSRQRPPDQQQEQQRQQQEQEAEQQDRQDQSGAERGQMTPEELKRILAAIEASDRETQEDLLKQAARARRISEKDW